LFGAHHFCLAEQNAWVGLGQACDAVNRCRAGLACVQGKDGRRCLEDCTNTRSCLLGGVCSAEKDGIAVCVCTPKTSCLLGRGCTEAFYLEKFGYCVAGAGSTRCFDTLECPPQMACQQGACVPSSVEVVPEAVSEPVEEAREEKAPVENDAEALSPEPVLDAGAKESPTQKEQTVEPEATPPTGGCGCAASQPDALSWAFLFLLLLGLLKRAPRQRV
ncbi:MAG: hypothetical protein H6727_20890, partial [Myxococcales bacterium]|nr:hypothetical protein [Myxococcales bacterium]